MMKKNLYVYNSGTLSRKDNTFHYVNEDKSIKKDYPVENIDSIYLFGKENLNTDFLCFLSRNDIIVHFFNYYGFYSGSFIPRNKYISGDLLVKQVQHQMDMEKRLYISKQFVIGCSDVILRNLKYYDSRGKDLKSYINEIEQLISHIQYVNDVPELMGIEGNIHKNYYKSWNIIVNQNIDFTKRIKHPPDNMINTLISFVNSLIYSLTLSEIYKTELNPAISYLHSCGEKRYSLCLDISEIFKPLIGDRMIFYLLNKNIITENDFVQQLNFLQIKENSSKKILEEFNKRIFVTIHHRDLNKEVSYRYLIRLECYKLIKHFLNEKDYNCFKIWW